MPQHFVDSMPPLRPELSDDEIAQVVEMWENQKANFKVIADKMNITVSKAKGAYEKYYQKKVWRFIDDNSKRLEKDKKIKKILNRYFDNKMTAQECYSMLQTIK